MTTGIFITARLGSTRLKKKHLLEINSQPIIYYLLKRIILEFTKEISKQLVRIIIVTSDEPENREFERFISMNVKIFYGSKYNIPLRHLQAAEIYSLQNIVNIDGDDILYSVKSMRMVFEELNKGRKYVRTINLPFGMNSFGYSTNFLKKSLTSNEDKILETGWGRIFDESELYSIDLSLHTDVSNLRYTLDYQEDYLFFKAVIEYFKEKIFSASDNEIVKQTIQNKFFLNNYGLIEKYWNNFQSNVKKESSH